MSLLLVAALASGCCGGHLYLHHEATLEISSGDSTTTHSTSRTVDHPRRCGVPDKEVPP